LAIGVVFVAETQVRHLKIAKETFPLPVAPRIRVRATSPLCRLR
jgi:hypothetical protein